MQISTPAYKGFLKSELMKRQAKNSRFSLRAYAEMLDLNPGNLSRVLRNQACLSVASLDGALRRLRLAEDEKRYLLTSVLEEQRAQARRSQPVLPSVGRFEPDDLADETIAKTSAWYHFAILELTTVEGFSARPAWIGKALGISTLEARQAVSRLKKVGLLLEGNQTLKKANRGVLNKNAHHTSTAAARLHLRQMLEKAIASLDNDPIEERYAIGMTMPIDAAKIPAVKKMTDDFVKSVCEFASAGRKQRVYQMNVNFFPLQRTPKNKAPL